MRATAAAVFVILLRATAASAGCPPIEEWRNATLSAGGPVVCAKLYATENCTGFSYPFGVSSSIPDLRHAFSWNVSASSLSTVNTTCRIYRTRQLRRSLDLAATYAYGPVPTTLES